MVKWINSRAQFKVFRLKSLTWIWKTENIQNYEINRKESMPVIILARQNGNDQFNLNFRWTMTFFSLSSAQLALKTWVVSKRMDYQTSSGVKVVFPINPIWVLVLALNRLKHSTRYSLYWELPSEAVQGRDMLSLHGDPQVMGSDNRGSSICASSGNIMITIWWMAMPT